MNTQLNGCAAVMAICVLSLGTFSAPEAFGAPSRLQFVDSGQRLGGNEGSLDVALGDVDGDGDLDAVAAKPGVPSQLWINQGGVQGGSAGTFVESGQVLAAGSGQSVALADLDADGDLDALFLDGDYSNNLMSTQVWLNQGGRQEGVQGLFLHNGQMIGAKGLAVALGELNGPPGLDAIIAHPNKVWFNDGIGQFVDSGQSLGNEMFRDIVLGDLDGDDDLDAFAVSFTNNIIWLNQGGAQASTSGTFLDSGQVMTNADGFGSAAGLGDLDGDGDMDVFVAGAISDVWVNQGGHQRGTHGVLRKSGQQHVSSEIVSDVALGDLDRDGDLDAFVARNGFNRVYENQGNGLFSDSGLQLASGFSLAVALGDLDGDGDLDAFVTGLGQPSQIWLNQTPPPPAPGYSSTPMPGSLFDFGENAGAANRSLHIANSNHDDLIIESISFVGAAPGLSLRKVNPGSTNSTPLGKPPFIIAEGSTLNLEISLGLLPNELGAFKPTLRIATNDPERPVVDYRIWYDATRQNFSETVEQVVFVLFLPPLLPPAPPAATQLTSFAPLALNDPQTATLNFDPNSPHSLISEVPAFLGGGSVQLSNFTGSVTVSLHPIPNDSERALIRVESGNFTAPSAQLPSGLTTGPNRLTFGPASQSDGILNRTTGEYTASATANIVNDLFPQGFPVRGTYRGTFDAATGRASVQSRSTDLFKVEDGFKFNWSGSRWSLTWMNGVLEKASNVLGPWRPLTSAASPYDVDTSQNEQQYFRLRLATP